MINKQYKITILFSLEYSEDNEGHAYDPLTNRELQAILRAAQQATINSTNLFLKYLTFGYCDKVPKIEEIIE